MEARETEYDVLHRACFVLPVKEIAYLAPDKRKILGQEPQIVHKTGEHKFSFLS